MNALNIQKKLNTPKLGSPVMLQIAINKLNYNLRTQNKTENKLSLIHISEPTRPY